LIVGGAGRVGTVVPTSALRPRPAGRGHGYNRRVQLAPDQVQALSRIGWRPELPAAAALASAPDGRLLRISAQHRSGYRATDGTDDLSLQAPAPWLRPRFPPEERAAVGDWVVAASDGSILALLPRHSLLKRGAAGEHYKQQLIAANVDTVLVVTGLDQDFNPRRIERYLVLVQGSGAAPVLVLTKADRTDTPVAEYLEPLAPIAERGIAIHVVNAKDPASVAQLGGALGPGRSAVLVGSSGAGKSTLTNTLLGREKQKTGDVREADSRGRHTTTHRALILLPSGGCLIDTPGMRELKLTGEEDLAEAGFEDVEALALQCRFSDCGHQKEPGCAVRAALDAGSLDPARLAAWRKLQEELAAAGGSLEAQRARRAEERVQSKALNKRLTDKHGRR
jgi:ribosome biogenesis GTPase